MPPTAVRARRSASSVLLPADDPELFALDLAGLRRRWAEAARRPAIGAEAMAGADRRAQLRGVTGQRLMEHAGIAVAAAGKALAEATGRWLKGPILILCGPGNNGGDGFVAARHLAHAGAEVVVVLVATEPRPSTPDAARNWDRLGNEPNASRSLAGNQRDLGTGVRGALRDPIRAAVILVREARTKGVPILAVDTPTAVDLSSGDPSEPVVHADLTVTFHRPKTGLLTRRGAALAGKVLVAPIGIPTEADRG